MAKFIPPKKQKSYLEGPKSIFSKVRSHFAFLKWLDPFTYVDLFVMPKVKKVSKSETLEFVVNVVFAFIFAAAIYTILGLLLQTSTPLVIVYSASMENTFFRGDVMTLAKPNSADNFGEVVSLDRNIRDTAVADFASPNYTGGKLSSITFFSLDSSIAKEVLLKTDGSIVVYTAYPSGLPIIHRAIVLIHALDGDFILTKGDNMETNKTFDEDCGSITTGSLFSQKSCITLYPVPVNELAGKVVFMIPKVGCVKLWLVDDFSSIISRGHLPGDFKGIC